MKQYLAAAPPWLGGKRRIAREIMQAVAEEREDGTPGVLADAFAGGCAVSIAAKALGWEVHANDMSPIAESTGQALIQNSGRTLEDKEIELALTAKPETGMPPERELSIPKNCRELLARLLTAANGGPSHPVPSAADWMLRAWIVKTALSMSTWGVPTMAAGRREWDELTPGQAQQLKRTGQPRKLALRTIAALNAGVFDNGRDNTMSRGDAVEFIGEQTADVLYLDPPYPGTLSYEEVYVGITHMLEPQAPSEPSDWSAADGWRLLEGVFDAAVDIPLWVVSMGKGANPEAIQEMMTERGRKASWRSIKHRHLVALKKKIDVDGDELLIVGKA